MVVDKSKLEFKADKLTMNFENLFNGDKQLSDTMNQFLNENWMDILNELRPSLSETMSQILIGLVSGTFSRIPYNEIFSDWSADFFMIYSNLFLLLFIVVRIFGCDTISAI